MMNEFERTKISKFLSLVLRHKPEEIGIVLDSNGWASIHEIISKTNEYKLDFDKIKEVIETNDKNRFSISNDQSKIRANQGHSISVDLALKEKEPPEILYHGTATRFIESIRKQGLCAQKRNHVHLSDNIKTATEVGQRYGKPIILKIHTHDMYIKGAKFYLSQNDVWLTENVPVKFIAFD